jgi:hypothetical protein
MTALLLTLAFVQPPMPESKPEPLPERPKADAKSELKALNKEETFFLEKKPDGTKRVLFAAEVCLREGPLEVFLCKARTKEHEAILRSELDARLIHTAMIAAGLEPGKTVRFINEKGEPDYKPASGAKVAVSVVYTKDGKKHEHAAQEWIQDLRTKKPMAHQWVFAGSRFVKNPEKPDEPEFYTANNGEVICISNFPDSMLDLPVQIGKDDDQLAFSAFTEKIPSLKSKVWVVLEKGK